VLYDIFSLNKQQCIYWCCDSKHYKQVAGCDKKNFK